jgi:hypothetical protein
MTITSFIAIALICWLVGFFLQRTETGTKGGRLRGPRWLFLFCGVPGMSRSPKHTLSSTGVFLQIVGLLLVLYRITIGWLVHDPDLSDLVGFLGAIVISSLLVSIFRKVYPNDS